MKSYNEQLTALRASGNLRHLPEVEHQGIWILKEGMRMLNLSSNDYLGLASRQDLQEEFKHPHKTASIPTPPHHPAC